MNTEFVIIVLQLGELYNMHCGEGVQFSIEILSLLLAMISICPVTEYTVLILGRLTHTPTQGWQTRILMRCTLYGVRILERRPRGDREVTQTYH